MIGSSLKNCKYGNCRDGMGPSAPTTQAPCNPVQPLHLSPISGEKGICRDGMVSNRPTNPTTMQSRPTRSPIVYLGQTGHFQDSAKFDRVLFQRHHLPDEVGHVVHPAPIRINLKTALWGPDVSQARSAKTDLSGFGQTRPKTCNTFTSESITIERYVLSNQLIPTQHQPLY